MFGELLYSCFTDPIGGSDEDCDEAGWQSGFNALVRGAYNF